MTHFSVPDSGEGDGKAFTAITRTKLRTDRPATDPSPTSTANCTDPPDARAASPDSPSGPDLVLALDGHEDSGARDLARGGHSLAGLLGQIRYRLPDAVEGR